MTNEVIALNLAVQDGRTGAVSDYHVLDSYYVAKSNGFVQATFATYVSKDLHDSGFSPVSTNIAINIAALPPKGECVEQWIYALAPEASGTRGEESPLLAGATPVLAAE